MAGKTKTIKLGLRLSHLYYITNNMNSKLIENVKMNIKNGLELFDKIAIERNIEIWRPITDYPNYEVSSLGNVKNVNKSRLLRPSSGPGGYKLVNLCVGNAVKTYLVHRLVALAFILNPQNKPYVDHINCIKTCNNVKNLRFVTNQQNQFNQQISSKNKSSIKGVSWYKRYRKWHAQICFDFKKIHIGYYNTLEEAKIARQKKAKELFGEYINSCEL